MKYYCNNTMVTWCKNNLLGNMVKGLFVLIVLIGGFVFLPRDRVEATNGRAMVRVYTTIDGQRVRLPGVTVLYLSKMSRHLWGTPYNYRSGPGIRHGYMVTDENGNTGLVDHVNGYQNKNAVWFDSCSGFGTGFTNDDNPFGIMIFGGSQRGTLVGGVPDLLSDELGLSGEGECTRAVCGQGRWDPYPPYTCDYEWGYMSALQCLSVIYDNNLATPPQNNEYYRFLPYFPPGYADAFLANSDNAALRSLADVFDDDSMKGGGRFKASSWYNPEPDKNPLRRDSNNVTFGGVSDSHFSYPGNEVTYLGRNSTPDNSSESIYLTGVSNNARVDVQFEWVFQQAECGNETCEAGETCDTNEQCDGDGILSPGECRPPGDPDECTYCGDGVVQNGEVCDDGNSNDNDSCNNNCQVPETTTTTSVEGEPAYAAEKNAGIQCINNDTAAVITYTISVRNTSDVDGRIETVTDTYDTRMQSSWISNIDPPPDSHTGNVIEWNNGGSGYPLAAGQEIEFSYQVTVPSEYFGTEEDPEVPYVYRNVAVISPEDSEDIRVEEEVMINCVPTGIFDHAVSAALAALFLIMAGFVWIRYHQEVDVLYHKVLTVWPFSEIHYRFFTPKKKKFEDKTLETVDPDTE